MPRVVIAQSVKWLVKGYNTDVRFQFIFFSAPHVRTGSGAHPALCSLGTGGSSPEGKATGPWSWPYMSSMTPILHATVHATFSTQLSRPGSVTLHLCTCGLFNGAVCSWGYKPRPMASNDRMISEYWIEKDMEGNGCGLIEVTIPAFAWGNWGKARKSSVSITDLRAEILIRDLPNTKQEC
jgi:hypothetical protein